MTEASGKLLVLLTGPVGGGKSTVAQALAGVLRKAGRFPAVIDLDLVYCMARQSEDFADENTWRAARQGSAALASVFFADGLDVVIVEGSFHDDRECDDVRKNLTSDVDVELVALDVSFEETARRVEADPAADRIVSRDPRVLSFLHSRFSAALPFLERSGTVVDADSATPEEIAERISELVL